MIIVVVRMPAGAAEEGGRGVHRGDRDIPAAEAAGLRTERRRTEEAGTAEAQVHGSAEGTATAGGGTLQEGVHFRRSRRSAHRQEPQRRRTRQRRQLRNEVQPQKAHLRGQRQPHPQTQKRNQRKKNHQGYRRCRGRRTSQKEQKDEGTNIRYTKNRKQS